MTIPVVTLDHIGSTNAEAMRLALAGVMPPLWVRAERQTAGRGRSGRPWLSPPGNLYASLLVRLECPPTAIHQLSFVAAVAAVAAIRRVATFGLDGIERPPRPPLRLKWPNDILVDGAKLVGILPESTITAERHVLAVVGVGINLAHAPTGFGRATTCLAAHGIEVAPPAMLDALSREMTAALALWDAGAGFPAIRNRWLGDADPWGTPMTISSGDAPLSGTFVGMDHDGALILRDICGYDHRRTYGDVTLETAQGG